MPLKIIHIHPSGVASERLKGPDLVLPNANVPIGDRWIILPSGKMVIAHRAGKP